MRNLKWIVLPVVIIMVWYSFSGGENESQYNERINKVINSRLDYLENDDQSPFKLFKEPYRKPDYFPVNQNYKVTGSLERFEKRETIQIQTSDGHSNQYQKYAWVHFKLNDESLKLLILKSMIVGFEENYFLAFADETSGLTTYGGGRYIEVTIGKSNTLELDFNLAYNPYCAYVDGYSCPLPPIDNILSIPIEAGEKDFKPSHP